MGQPGVQQLASSSSPCQVKQIVKPSGIEWFQSLIPGKENVQMEPNFSPLKISEKRHQYSDDHEEKWKQLEHGASFMRFLTPKVGSLFLRCFHDLDEIIRVSWWPT